MNSWKVMTPFALALGMFAVVSTPSCSAPRVRVESVLGMVELMDERVDAYLAADAALDEFERASLGFYGDAAIQLLVEDEDGKVVATALRARVTPLWEIEKTYTLADPELTPRSRAALLRTGLLVITITTRADGLPDPPPLVVPGDGPVSPEPDPGG